jgi:hypothetical protein
LRPFSKFLVSDIKSDTAPPNLPFFEEAIFLRLANNNRFYFQPLDQTIENILSWCHSNTTPIKKTSRKDEDELHRVFTNIKKSLKTI